MSTFAVFGMTRDAALIEARKKTPTIRAQGGVAVPITMDEWLEMVEAKADSIMASDRVRCLSQLYDAPQYAQQFIDLARRSGQCRDMRIRALCALTDALGKPIKDPKTGAPKYGFTDWQPVAASA